MAMDCQTFEVSGSLFIEFMKDLENQGHVARYTRQDSNRNRIEHLHKLLDEGMQASTKGPKTFICLHIFYSQ